MSNIFIEVLTTMWQVVWGLLSGIGKAVFDNLPALLELKKVMDYFTPARLIALSIGVPTIMVTVVIKVIKKFLRSR